MFLVWVRPGSVGPYGLTGIGVVFGFKGSRLIGSALRQLGLDEMGLDRVGNIGTLVNKKIWAQDKTQSETKYKTRHIKINNGKKNKRKYKIR